MDIGKRRVAEDFLRYRQKRIHVSTVFLAMDHGFAENRPVLWETMVFGGPCDDHMERYSSRTAAKAGHRAIVAIQRLVIKGEERQRARRSRMHAAYGRRRR